ncbi:MAG TPA: hypothetical protein OQH54_04000 [Nitrosopumilus sp.]|nr:hypothetical protein [Thermoproteota archaeon]HJJ22860.1 hypothetical protein [Nitrosopumilus sp.]
MNNIIFDGKWTFEREWKQSSLKEIHTEEDNVYLRISHQDEFVFIFLDVLPDKQMERIVDKAIICFDTKNNKSEIPDVDDYCFIAAVGKQTGITLQGDSKIPRNNYLKNIKNHQDMIAIGGFSDENDRYSDIPHASYEFKIPTELIGRSDNYGFYASVFDYNSETVYSWPSINFENPNIIPSPSKWGDVISPDRSIPEMPVPLVILSVLLISVVGITRKIGFSRY